MLLQAFSIKCPLISCHEHNEKRQSSKVVERILRGQVSKDIVRHGCFDVFGLSCTDHRLCLKTDLVGFVVGQNGNYLQCV